MGDLSLNVVQRLLPALGSGHLIKVKADLVASWDVSIELVMAYLPQTKTFLKWKPGDFFLILGHNKLFFSYVCSSLLSGMSSSGRLSHGIDYPFR